MLMFVKQFMVYNTFVKNIFVTGKHLHTHWHHMKSSNISEWRPVDVSKIKCCIIHFLLKDLLYF